MSGTTRYSACQQGRFLDHPLAGRYWAVFHAAHNEQDLQPKVGGGTRGVRDGSHNGLIDVHLKNRQSQNPGCLWIVWHLREYQRENADLKVPIVND